MDGVLVHDSSRDDFQITVTNRKRISDFPEEDQKKILMGNSAYDAENDIYKLARKINVGFVPAPDSLKKCNITIENIASFVKDLSSETLKSSPHFYVLGIKVDLGLSVLRADKNIGAAEES